MQIDTLAKSVFNTMPKSSDEQKQLAKLVANISKTLKDQPRKESK